MSSHGDEEETTGDVELAFGRVLFSEQADAVDRDSGESRRAGSDDYAAAVQAAIDSPRATEVPSQATAPTPRVPKIEKGDRKGGEEVSVICCDETSNICGGQIGRKSMFCIRDADQCTTGTHEKVKIFSTEDKDTYGLYVRGSGQHYEQASSDVFLPRNLASDDQLRRYPTMVKNKEAWRQVFSLCTTSTLPMTCLESEEELRKLFSALSSKTPSRGVENIPTTLPKVKLVPIKPDPGKTESWGITAGREFVDFSIEFQDSARNQMATMQESVRNSVEKVLVLTKTLNNVNRRLLFTEGLVGSNKQVEAGMPATLWGSTSLLKTMVDELDELCTERAHILPTEMNSLHNNVKALQTDAATTSAGLTSIKAQVDTSKRGLASSMSKIAGSLRNFQTDLQALASQVSSATTSHAFGASPTPPTSTVDLENRMLLLESKLNLGLAGDRKGVKLGGLGFGSPADLEAWQKVNTPGDLPFGAFTDFFVLMGRISTGHKSQNEILKNMDLAKRLVMTAGECLLLGTFENRLPSLLGKESATVDATSTKTSYFPAISTRTHFVNDSRMGGTLVLVTDQLPNVQSQIGENIRQVFQNHP